MERGERMSLVGIIGIAVCCGLLLTAVLASAWALYGEYGKRRN
jgi:hypothetical protein